MNFKLLCGSVAVASLMLTSCFDDKYNLDDIDTTSRINVNDLVIPVNIDDVYLSDVIKIDDDSQLQVRTIDGKDYYVVTESGTFDSDPIFIKAVYSKAEDLSDKLTTLTKSGSTYPVPELGNDFTYECADVDESIVDITAARVNNLTFTLAFEPDVNVADYTAVYFTDVQARLPKGLVPTDGSDYDPATGIWTIGRMDVNGETASASLVASQINFGDEDTTFENHTFTFTSNFSVVSGNLNLEGGSQPTDVGLVIQYDLSDLDITAFSGRIMYALEGMGIDPIMLDNIPDFLQDSETNISLVNPLLCLQTTNPVAGNNLMYQAGITLTSIRPDDSEVSYSSSEFNVGYDLGNTVGYNTILSPMEISASKGNTYLIPSGYEENFNWFEYAGLGSLLAAPDGSTVLGLPKEIKVDVTNPQIPEQEVEFFEIGRNITGVDGKYELFAPLSLEPGSIIVYSDTRDGWGDDLKDLNLDKLTITADAQNLTPLSIQLTIYPIDENGNRMEGVELTSNTLGAYANKKLSFTLTGVLTGLDGVEFIATVVAKDDQTISPDNVLIFKNIRATVNGYYEKEF